MWLNGQLVPADAASVSVFDRGFRNGEGVFETFRSYQGHVFRLSDHLDRAYRGAEVLGFDPGPRDRLERAVTTTATHNLEALQGGDGALRLTVTPGRLVPSSPFPGTPDAGTTVVVTAHPLAIDVAIYRDGIAAVRVPLARELPHVKALSYLAPSLARAEARRRGAAEALLVDREGRILEGASSNVFAVLDGALVTPPVGAGILPGVTRTVVLEQAQELGLQVREEPLGSGLVGAADELFVTATTREVVPVVRLDDSPVGDGTPGAVTKELHEAYRRAVDAERRP